MAITILPQEETLASKLGTALGTGITGGVDELIQNKLQRMKTAPALQALLDVDPRKAEALAGLDPQLLQEAIRGTFKERAARGKLEQEGKDPGFKGRLEAALGEQVEPQPAAQEQFAQPEEVPQAEQEPTALAEPITREQRVEQEIQKLDQRIADPNISGSDRSLFRKERDKREDQLEKFKKEKIEAGAKVFELNKAQIEDIRNKSNAAKQQELDLQRLIELDETGKLDTATYDAFLRNSGFDIAALRSPESQEFNKITQSFIKNLKNIFGGRISNQEMENFMKTLPTLSQSPEGRKRVISNMLRFNRIDQEKGNLLNRMIKKNNGVLPGDFLAQIEDKMGKRLDNIAKQFKKDLKRKVPGAEGVVKVATGAAAGRAVPIAAGAATGFLFGGPVGSALGGIAGAAFPSAISALKNIGQG